jgi:hypothetical protein
MIPTNNTQQQTTTSDQLSGEQSTGDTTQQDVSGDTLQPDTNTTETTSEEPIDTTNNNTPPDTTTHETPTPPQEETPAPVATKSTEELINIGKILQLRAKKLAIIAATQQNLSAKMSAVSIQSAAEKLTQELENDGNIDTLGKKEQELTSLIQRFISLAKTLNGSSQ